LMLTRGQFHHILALGLLAASRRRIMARSGAAIMLQADRARKTRGPCERNRRCNKSG
jgi:hypothetical protein